MLNIYVLQLFQGTFPGNLEYNLKTSLWVPTQGISLFNIWDQNYWVKFMRRTLLTDHKGWYCLYTSFCSKDAKSVSLTNIMIWVGEGF